METTKLNLNLPPREPKPRQQGLSCVIDNGYPYPVFEAYIRAYAPYIDFVKFGWGTSYLDPEIEQKIALLRAHHVDAWLGGTLFEVAYAQNKVDGLADWCRALGLQYFEVSDGTLIIDPNEKLRVIEKLSKSFRVLSEVGSKDAELVMSPRQWVKHIENETQAGAWKIITEGRESGTAGMFRSTGEVRFGLLQEIQESSFDVKQLIFEAPQKNQQIWFIKELGADVNFSNIALTDSLNLETLRRGLRSDTLYLSTTNEAAHGDISPSDTYA